MAMNTYKARVADLLFAADAPDSVLPPSSLYCEGWMLRLVLDWFSRQPVSDHPLAFGADARWASEALLPTQFRARQTGPRQAEGLTHADAVIGHFRFRDGRRAVALESDARQFVVVEAKMFSALSRGTRYAPEFDQAARNVACMAETVARASVEPGSFERLAFVVVAPAEQVARGLFDALVRGDRKEALAATVKRHVEGFGDSKVSWYERAFLPVLSRMDITVLTWESIVGAIAASDPETGASLGEFLARCLDVNRPRSLDRPVVDAALRTPVA